MRADRWLKYDMFPSEFARISEACVHPSFVGRKRRHVAEYVFSDKERIIPGAIAADKGEAFPVRRKAHCRQGRPPVEIRRVGVHAVELRVIRHADSGIRSERAVVFHDQDPWADHVDSVENPVVVAVDVDGQKPNIASDPSTRDRLVDVLARDEYGERVDGVTPPDRIRPDEVNVRGPTIEDQPAPVVVAEQEPCVRLAIVANTKLDKCVVFYRHPTDQVLNDAVLAELREDSELGIAQRAVSPRSHRATLNSADSQEQPIEIRRCDGTGAAAIPRRRRINLSEPRRTFIATCGRPRRRATEWHAPRHRGILAPKRASAPVFCHDPLNLVSPSTRSMGSHQRRRRAAPLRSPVREGRPPEGVVCRQ